MCTSDCIESFARAASWRDEEASGLHMRPITCTAQNTPTGMQGLTQAEMSAVHAHRLGCALEW